MMIVSKSDRDKEAFERVLRGIRGDNPRHKKATADEKRKAEAIVEAQKKALVNKYNKGKKPNKRKRNDGDGDVFDTGMFSS